MPQLPQYDTPQVKPAGIPGPVARPDAPLAAFGGGERMEQAQNAAEGVADQSAELALKKAERGRQMAVDSEVYGAAAQLSSMHTQLTNDAKSQLGRNSFGIYNPTMDSFRQQAAQIGSQLQTPEAKQMYQKLVFEHQVQLDHTLQDHIATQRMEDTKQTIAAASEQFENAALSTATTDPRATKFNLRMAAAADRDLAKNAGLWDQGNNQPSVAGQAFIDGRQSGRQLQILNAYVSAGQDLAAQEYFQANKDDFKGKDLIKAQDLTIEGAARGRALREVDKIFSPSVGVVEGGEGPVLNPGAQTLGEAQAKVRDIQDPKVRAYAEQEVSRRWAMVQEDLEQQRKATLNGFSNVLEKNGGDLNGMISTNPQAWMSLTATQRRELQDYSESIYKRVDPKTDFDTWYDLMRMAKDPNTEKAFSNINLRDPYYLNRLSPEKRTQLATMQGEITNKTAATVGKLSFQNQISDSVEHYGILESHVEKLNEKDKARLAQFSAQLDRDYDNFKAYNLQNAREPNEKERQDLIDFRLGQRSEIQSWFSKPLGVTGAPITGMVSGNRHIPSAMVLPEEKIVTERGFFSNTTIPGSSFRPEANPNIKSQPAAPVTDIDRVTWSRLIADQKRPVTEEKMRRLQEIWNTTRDKDQMIKIARE